MPAPCSWSTRPGCSTKTAPAPHFASPRPVAPKVALIGDGHQVPAVGRGGIVELAARHAADRYTELGGVHRFTDPDYADLSLKMRSGARPGEVFDELLRRGEIVIHASDVERHDVLAAKASRGELVAADTREQITPPQPHRPPGPRHHRSGCRHRPHRQGHVDPPPPNTAVKR